MVGIVNGCCKCFLPSFFFFFFTVSTFMSFLPVFLYNCLYNTLYILRNTGIHIFTDFFNITFIKYNKSHITKLHIIKFTLSRCTIPWIFENLHGCATNCAIKEQESSITLSQAHPWHLAATHLLSATIM